VRCFPELNFFVDILFFVDSLNQMAQQSTWFLYMIRCADNSLYTGITIDIDRRFAEHQSQSPKCAKYLRGRGPLELVLTTPVGSKSAASQLELRLKKCSKATKEKLIAAYRLGSTPNIGVLSRLNS
jgi:putative endonuclease